MRSTRLWITGVGLVTSVGKTTDATFNALLEGRRGIVPIDLFDTTGQRAVLAGALDARILPKPPTVKTPWSRTSAIAFAAAKQAIAQAGLDIEKQRVGLVVATTTAGMFETETRLAELHADQGRRDAIVQLLAHPLSATSDSLHEAMGPFSRIRTLSSACSGGANALIVAATWLLSGLVDVVVAGGSDGLCRLTLSGFNALSAIDPEPCRPFDRRRRGLNLGEGAGFVVLERSASAIERGVSLPLCELAGWAFGSEAHHITNPDPSGRCAGRVIAAAIARASLDASMIDYVNAHGTGTPLNDPMEATALARVFGDEIRRIPVSSSKAQIGHTLGAAGAIEAGISALTIAHQAIVPTAGLEEPDDACALVHVFRKGRSCRVRSTLSNSFGFGGMDTALVFTEPELAPAHSIPAQGKRVVVTAAATLTPQGLLGTHTSDRLLDPHATVGRGVVGVDVSNHLELSRARRLDRPARLSALTVMRALSDAEISREVFQGGGMGLVLASAFGTIDATAAFMHHLFEKGPRFMSPATFPNLVPSSPVGHVSIYLGIAGPALVTADLGQSGESACAQAIELVLHGEADVVVAGGVEELSKIAQRTLSALVGDGLGAVDDADPERMSNPSEGAAAIVFESEDGALLRGKTPLARVAELHLWRDDARGLPTLGAPSRNAELILPMEHEHLRELVGRTPWSNVPRLTCRRAAGDSWALGSIAVAAAVSRIGNGIVDDALVIGHAHGRGSAIRLVAPAR